MSYLYQYFLNFAMALDQFASTLLGGHPDDTISQRLGRAKLVGNKGYIMNLSHDFVDFLAKVIFNEDDHCVNSLKGKSLAREIWNWGGSRLEDKELIKQYEEIKNGSNSIKS